MPKVGVFFYESVDNPEKIIDTGLLQHTVGIYGAVLQGFNIGNQGFPPPGNKRMRILLSQNILSVSFKNMHLVIGLIDVMGHQVMVSVFSHILPGSWEGNVVIPCALGELPTKQIIISQAHLLCKAPYILLCGLLRANIFKHTKKLGGQVGIHLHEGNI